MKKLSSRNERLVHIHDAFYDRLAKNYDKTIMLRVDMDEKFCPASHNDKIENHE